MALIVMLVVRGMVRHLRNERARWATYVEAERQWLRRVERGEFHGDHTAMMAAYPSPPRHR